MRMLGSLVASLVLLAGCAGKEVAGTAAQIASLRAEVAELKAQSQFSRDYVDIANLQAIYGYYVDKSRWDPDVFVPPYHYPNPVTGKSR